LLALVSSFCCCVQIRLMVSRGPKSTPYQNPKVTLGKPAIAILPEWKEAALGEHTTIDYIREVSGSDCHSCI
jgi:hypothetical protein